MISIKTVIRSLTYLILLGFVFLICAGNSTAQQEYVNPIDAHKYIGMEKTVCGTVASATYAIRTKGRPTFLNLDQPYPKHIFTVVIWGSDRNRFINPPEIFFKNKRICVTGTIKEFRGKPEIVVRKPEQIVAKPQ